MEGYLIRLPASAWASSDEDTRDVALSMAKTRTTRNRRTNNVKPKARLLYYILGEGFLNGFASPDDTEPVERFQLTSFEVDVEPIFSMAMFRVTTRRKRPVPGHVAPSPANHDCSSSEDEDDHDDCHATPPSATSSLLLFAGDKLQVDLWGRKILNWNRYVFAGGNAVEETPRDCGQAKGTLMAAFHHKNNRGMFAMPCQLEDATTARMATPDISVDHHSTTVSLEAVVLQEDETKRLPPPQRGQMPSFSHKQMDDVSKPVVQATEIKPLWMLLSRSASRRISAVPYLRK